MRSVPTLVSAGQIYRLPAFAAPYYRLPAVATPRLPITCFRSPQITDYLRTHTQVYRLPAFATPRLLITCFRSLQITGNLLPQPPDYRLPGAQRQVLRPSHSLSARIVDGRDPDSDVSILNNVLHNAPGFTLKQIIP